MPGLEIKSTRRVKFWLESFKVSSFHLGIPEPVRLWTMMFTPCQILREKRQNVWYSELQVLQRVWFWVKKSTTCQILRQKLYKVSNFVSWSSKRVSFWAENYKKCQIVEKVIFKSSRESFRSAKLTCFALFVLFQRHSFEKNNVHCVRIVMNKIKTCQVLL